MGLRGVDGGPMGCGWGADEACLRARAEASPIVPKIFLEKCSIMQNEEKTKKKENEKKNTHEH